MDNTNQNQSMFIASINEWMQWSSKTFPRSTEKSCMIGLRREIEEVIDSMTYGTDDEQQLKLEEYADCFLYLLSGLERAKFSFDELKIALIKKMRINYTRQWKLNPDNTYSHVK